MFDYKHKASLILLVGGLAMGSLLPSCKDNDDAYSSPSLTLTQGLESDVLSFTEEGLSKLLSFESNRKWTASSSASWLDITPRSGDAGSAQISITTLPNKGVDREAILTLSYGSVRKNITIKQTGSGTTSPDVYEGMRLSDFITKYYKEEEEVVIPDDVSFQAVVLTDIAENNTNSLKNITVQADGDKGLAIRLASNANPETFAPGKLFTFKAKGAKLMRYQGGLQLDFTGVDGSAVASTGETRTIEPKVVSFKDIYAGKYENILVAVDGVQFEKPGAVLATDRTGYHAITDLKTNPTESLMAKLSVAVSKYAKFKEQTSSDKNGRIIGILAYSTTATRKNYNIYPRTIADIQLTNERKTSADSSNTEGNTSETPSNSEATTTLAKFITDYDRGSSVAVDKDEIFEAVLLTDTQGNNTTGLKNITVQIGEQGINLRLKANNSFPKNTVLLINAKGATVQRYQGSLQIDYTNAPQVEIKSAGRTQEITPKVVTLSDIYSGKYINTLVTVEGLQLETTGIAFNSKAKGNYFHTLSDCATQVPAGSQALSLAISSYVQFKNLMVSDKRGRITGILLYNENNGQKRYNLWIRDLSDLQLTEERCTAGTPAPSPAPTPTSEPTPAPSTPPASAGEPIISAYYEGIGMDKFIQIYNPGTQAIELSEYAIKLEAFNTKNETNGIKKVKLTGTLAPQGILIVRNSGTDKVLTGVTLFDSNEVANFNGNDNIALFKGETLIDVIGTWGRAWLNGKKPAATDVYIKRKASVTRANSTYTESEWESTASIVNKNIVVQPADVLVAR